MTPTIEAIKALKGTFLGRRLTIHDVGVVEAELVLGIKCEDEIDIWYVALDIKNCNLYFGAPHWYANKNILYFPEMKVDAQAYGELTNENR